MTELHGLRILDTPPEDEYDDLAALAAAVCRAPVAAVNFVDDTRHFTKAIVGMPEGLGRSVSNEQSLCAATICAEDGVLVVPDTRADEEWREHPLVTGGPRVGSYAGVSIVSRGERVGVVCVFGDNPRHFSDQERIALTAVARQATRSLDLRRHNSDLRGLALTDPLTGLANRTLLVHRLEAAIADRRRTGEEVGVFFCDVDDFKAVNDRFGHEAGDRLLCRIAEHVRAEVRDTDVAARIAGDEFALVCPRLGSEANFAAVAERLAGAVAQDPMAGMCPAPVLSVGWARVLDGDRAGDVLQRADAAMYVVKAKRREGRQPGSTHAAA